MIEHFKILGLVIILMLGIASIAYTFSVNHRLPGKCLVYLIKYTITTNLAFVIMFLYHYFSQNLPEGAFDPQNVYIKGLTDILTNIIGILSVYFLAGLILSFREVQIGKTYRLFIGLFILLVSGLYLARLLGAGNALFGLVLDGYSTYFTNNLVFLEILMLLLSIFIWKRATDQDARTLSTYYSLIYLFGYVITFSTAIIAPMIPVGNAARQMMGFLILAYFNLAPIIWIRYVYLPYARRMKNLIADRTDFESIFHQYNITKREEEIIELILEGKSNSEIQGKLFISFHTVKNHLSNIYRKLNVGSRYELVHFFIKKMN